MYNMRKLLVLFMFAVSANCVFAQWGNYGYYGGISPQIYYDPCVQSSIGVARSANWVMQYDQMIMQQQQWMMNNGMYNNQNTSSSSNSRSTSRSGRYVELYEKCIECGGKGYNVRELYMGGGNIRKVKSNCGYCNGRGKIRTTKYVRE